MVVVTIYYLKVDGTQHRMLYFLRAKLSDEEMKQLAVDALYQTAMLYHFKVHSILNITVAR